MIEEFACQDYEDYQLKSICLSNLNLSLIESTLIKTYDEGLLGDIIKNRDWSENERYNLKAEVDDILKNSKLIKEERNKIKLIFRRNDNLKEAIEIYLSEANNMVGKLKEFFDKVLKVYLENGLTNLSELKLLWKEFLELADIDNAHAMYLSSGMWDFSVFNPVLEELKKLCPDQVDFYRLLSGGIKDIRTKLYCLSKLQSKFRRTKPKDLSDFLFLLEKDFIDDSTIFLIFTYNFCNDLGLDDEKELKRNYLEIINNIYLKIKDKESFLRILTLYIKLNKARIEYDTFEYFGYYAFARNLLIICTYIQLKSKGIAIAEEFRKMSSLYQYDLLNKNINFF